MTAKPGIIAAACAACMALTMSSEGLVLKAKPDPVGIATDCYGHTEGVKAGQIETPAACLQILRRDLVTRGTAADRCITRPIPLKVRAAMTDFAFNAGVGAFCGSTMAQRLNAGDLAGACAELSRWVYAGGRQLPGLVARRAKERALCVAGVAGR